MAIILGSYTGLDREYEKFANLTTYTAGSIGIAIALYGQSGTGWLPIKVTANGYVITASGAL